MSEHETIADIIAEMRDWLGDANSYDLRSLADRLEAAWKRGKAEAEANALAVGGMVEASRATAKKSLAVGDMAKLREALEAAHRTLKLVYENAVEFIQPRLADEIIHTGSAIESALAEPVRNCEVGTAEEQTRRMEAEYCHVQKSCYESPSGRECPLHKAEVDCRLIWAQMPYGEEQKGEFK